MRIWGILLILFLTLSSSGALGAPPPSVKQLLLNLEKELREGAPKELLKEELKKIEKSKEFYPVNYLPELNYLTKSQVEKIPRGELSAIKKGLFHLEALKRAIEILAFILLFYTLTFYLQHTEAEPTKKRFLTFGTVLILAASTILNLKHLFIFLIGTSVLPAFKLRKRKTSFFLLFSGLFLATFAFLLENGTLLANSPSHLYNIKTARDSSSPYYLIDLAFKDPLKRELEKATSDLALGELSAMERLKKIEKKIKDRELLAVALNDMGYAAFIAENYKEALKYFIRANNLTESPTILFNLYLTYSSLLRIEEAEKIREKLLEKGWEVQVSQIPLLIHLKASEPPFKIPAQELLALLTGLFFSLAVVKLLRVRADKLNSEVLQIPGMMSFLNSNYKPFLLIFILSLIANYLMGRATCSI